ncbi:MAG: hypothetical protein RL417_170 [Pseudomonadota bacterium]|jgi:uncharacterized protein (DUF342 family)
MAPTFTVDLQGLTLAGELSPDKLKLFINAQRTAEVCFQRDDLLKIIGEKAPLADVIVGVIDDIVACLNRGEPVTERLIAKGTMPIPGRDGKLVLLVKKFSDRGSVKIDKRGYADFRDLHLFDNVTKGQILGRVYPPKPGTSGKDALGNALPAAPGKPATANLDVSVKLMPPNDGEEFQTIVADGDGYLAEENGRFVIKSELVIKGDLGPHLGNIDFIGKVKIEGDVAPGLSVKARDGIEIGGGVNGGSLWSLKGDITVKGFYFGGERTQVVCGGNLTLAVAQDVRAEVVGNITVQREAIDCRFRTQAAVMATQGSLIGGEVYSVCGVEGRFLGNDSGKKTVLILCSDVETSTEFSKIVVNLATIENGIKLVKLHLGPLAVTPERIQLLREPHRSKMMKLLGKLKELDDARLKLLAKKTKMLENARVNDTFRVNYIAWLYTGTTIEAGEKRFEPKDSLAGPGSVDYVLDRDQFEVGPLKGLVCVVPPAGGALEAEKK